MIKKLLKYPFFIRLFHWEYWPFHVLYGPLYPYWIWLCARSRSFFFFNTANPSIKNGGFLMESKWSIYSLMPSSSYPPTVFIDKGSSVTDVLNKVKQQGLSYPLIGKPDIGMKGMSVKKLENDDQLAEYVQNSKVDFLVQAFVPYEKEAGIFYYRFPGEKKGHISGIVGKEFLAVHGDGKSTIRALLLKDKRYILQLPVLSRGYGRELEQVLAKNEERVLVPYGNHVRGAKFVDITHLADEKLTATIDSLCRSIDGFYFGRLDIRYRSWEELRAGQAFSVIELNGAGSEPTHMYDPAHSLFFAWKEIIRHWNILSKISRLNHHPESRPYMKTRSGLNMLLENKKYVKLIAGMGHTD